MESEMGKTANKEVTRTAYQGDELRWEAVRQRDAGADGEFWYSVRSTGVYCRPSCGARPALRKNVAFHDSREAAEQAGFRPCLRCKPDQPPLAERQAAIVAQACRLIDAAAADAESAPDLDSLATAVGVSRFHFHRMFKAVTGITPKAYANAQRARRMQDGLAQQATVTDAMYAAGYNSSGRFYAQTPSVLGMTPTAFRAGGRGAQIRFAIGACSLGAILVASTEQGICAILIDDDPDVLVRDLQDRFPKAELIGAEPEYEQVVSRVVGMVERPEIGLDLPLDVRGTAFQQRVWQVLREIPAGRTVSYAELAALVGSPKGARAVAGACAANALAVAIPCHRVVRNDGSISGYRWGVDRKAALLDRESGK
ncbi:MULTISPECIES: bifunctional DNA-binding transcriptional regulator/O6-methylguanine-DNA methyltransferase Ada [unclassified Duganella]|uniref:bifunctional DNA-binding transcriptional regulator/O6-methylguanine-DNA methyltransferase Ada n=1 Tax=unclassified Duganella TaxID=2636909 RepID=UPI000E348AE5|nr:MULTISPECIES: bifunctional DNA-binding transcriptional regulator/O6-methylguanine-DNA methyltransferase Ada [unclassified Duganella]RFP12172.1 bifunctional DNA-binding transcriptional regulator/O6-methylguanine-DNA methyltransferase Ada [Duganella sp. BJB475]RFP29816.1 bifunctional DNA-binding transcriptional regulator/O6-methylguanine-DNA methyltransferase Ada [Duganella sp. BJB476]